MSVGETMEQTKWNESKLTKNDWYELKRNAGLTMDEATAGALIAYRRARNAAQQGLYRDKIDFACLCMRCMWDKNVSKKISLPTLIQGLKRDSNLADVIKDRCEGILNETWRDDGYLLKMIHSLLCLIRKKSPDIMPDFDMLANDLAHWDDRNVKRFWIDKIY